MNLDALASHLRKNGCCAASSLFLASALWKRYNSESSRSHAVFELSVQQTWLDSRGEELQSKSKIRSVRRGGRGGLEINTRTEFRSLRMNQKKTGLLLVSYFT